MHSAREVAALDAAVVDYAVAGPVFETPSKPGYGPALGGAGLAAVVQVAPVPVLAIGGVTAANVPQCWQRVPPASPSWVASCVRPIRARR